MAINISLSTLWAEIPNRRSQSFFGRPLASDKPMPKYAEWNSGAKRPVSNAHSFAVKIYKLVASLVAKLLSSCRPTNIPRLVVAVIVGIAVDAVLGAWTMANVCNEVLELQPALAHGYSSAAVIVPRSIIRVRASLDDRVPDVELRDVPTPAGVAVLDPLLCSKFVANTSARLAFSGYEKSFRYRSHRPAITPSGELQAPLGSSLRDKFNNHPSTESFSNEIAVLHATASVKLSVQTPAGFALARYDHRLFHDLFVPAYAPDAKIKSQFFCFPWMHGNHSPSTEYLSDQRLCRYDVLSHASFLDNGAVVRDARSLARPSASRYFNLRVSESVG